MNRIGDPRYAQPEGTIARPYIPREHLRCGQARTSLPTCVVGSDICTCSTGPLPTRAYLQTVGLFGVGETPWLVGRCRVMSGNTEMRDAVRGHQREGWVEILKRDEDGRLEMAADGELARVRVDGVHVRLEEL